MAGATGAVATGAACSGATGAAATGGVATGGTGAAGAVATGAGGVTGAAATGGVATGATGADGSGFNRRGRGLRSSGGSFGRSSITDDGKYCTNINGLIFLDHDLGEDSSEWGRDFGVYLVGGNFH